MAGAILEKVKHCLLLAVSFAMSPWLFLTCRFPTTQFTLLTENSIVNVLRNFPKKEIKYS